MTSIFALTPCSSSDRLTNSEGATIRSASSYSRRLAAFAEFYAAFYKGERTYDLDPARQLDVVLGGI